MYDKKNVNVSTGNVIVIVVASLAVISLGVGSFFYFKKGKKRGR